MAFFSRTKQGDSKTIDPTKNVVDVKSDVADDVAVAVTAVVGADVWRVLVRPIVSEKAATANVQRQYVFEVQLSASKSAIKDAVQATYGVRPVRVNVVRMRSRSVRRGKNMGTIGAWKKAIVTLPEGKTIKVYEGV